MENASYLSQVIVSEASPMKAEYLKFQSYKYDRVWIREFENLTSPL